MSATRLAAPGGPGIEPRWTSSAKCGVGTAVAARSRVWFTVSHGIVNEVYYPRVDLANIRDFGLLITDGVSYFSEEKRHTISEVSLMASGVPGYRMTNTSIDGRYRIVKTVITDPLHDVLLQDIQFEPLIGCLDDYRVYALLAPHIRNQGRDNTGWLSDYKGIPMLFAQRDDCALALASSVGFAAATCGYVGVNDGWQELVAHKRLRGRYTEAVRGNIALTGEVDLAACDGHFALALAFGRDSAVAGQSARASLLRTFDQATHDYVEGWQAYQAQCRSLPSADDASRAEYRVSIAVLKTHEDKDHPGAVIASLSVPWGNSKGDHDLGGYHLVWPRDLVQSVTGLLAAGDAESARRALFYLMSTQEHDGHWAQNMWLDGTPYWNGVQMDETGFPILLADALRREHGLDGIGPWPMVRRAAAYIIRNGPATPQDRWEENSGYSPFTIAVEIAALLAAAEFADEAGDDTAAKYMRETADEWNQNIERWMYVTGVAADRLGVDGFYARIAPRAGLYGDTTPLLPIRNRMVDAPAVSYQAVVSPDALALVRYGLRAADDPRIVNTVQVIDALLREQTATGPVWHRYNGDGYGEHDDGSPFDGTGVGRGWPLLAGERGHYELAAGRPAEAQRLLNVIRAQTNPGGLIPEQVWDAPDIEPAALYNGAPSGGAMPLAWAHAEYVKLARSLSDGRVYDTPPYAAQRYLHERRSSPHASWRFSDQVKLIPAQRTLRIEVCAAALLHWSADDWQTTHDAVAASTDLGIWYVDLPSASLPPGSSIRFTFFWLDAQRWEGTDFAVGIDTASHGDAPLLQARHQLVDIREHDRIHA